MDLLKATDVAAHKPKPVESAGGRPPYRVGGSGSSDAAAASRPGESTGARPMYRVGWSADAGAASRPGESTGARRIYRLGPSDVIPQPAEPTAARPTGRPESAESSPTPVAEPAWPLPSLPSAKPLAPLSTDRRDDPRGVRPDSATLPLPAVTPAVEPTAAARSRHGLPDLDRSSATQGLPVVPTTTVQPTGRHHRPN